MNWLRIKFFDREIEFHGIWADVVLFALTVFAALLVTGVVALTFWAAGAL